MNDNNLKHYDSKFFQMLEKFRVDYNHVADWIAHVLHGNIVGDIGCGSGFIIERLATLWWLSVWGCDGSSIVLDHLHRRILPCVKIVDLTQSGLKMGYADIAVCIEVAEHLPEGCADQLVQYIVDTEAETLVFTAATPNQKGVNHINLQPHSYWIEKFEKHGYKLHKALVDKFKRELDTKIKEARWLINNIMIFTK